MKSSVVLDRVFFHFEEFRVLRDHRRRVVAEIVDDIRLVEAAAALVRADVVAGDPVVRMCESKCKEKHCHRSKADPEHRDFGVQDAGADGGEADRERREEPEDEDPEESQVIGADVEDHARRGGGDHDVSAAAHDEHEGGEDAMLAEGVFTDDDECQVEEADGGQLVEALMCVGGICDAVGERAAAKKIDDLNSAENGIDSGQHREDGDGCEGVGSPFPGFDVDAGIALSTEKVRQRIKEDKREDQVNEDRDAVLQEFRDREVQRDAVQQVREDGVRLTQERQHENEDRARDGEAQQDGRQCAGAGFIGVFRLFGEVCEVPERDEQLRERRADHVQDAENVLAGAPAGSRKPPEEQPDCGQQLDQAAVQELERRGGSRPDAHGQQDADDHEEEAVGAVDSR